MNNHENDFQILRIVIASNISGTVLADYALPEWTYIKEDKAIARLFQTLMSIPKEFDNESLRQVSFKVGEESMPQVSRHSNAGIQNTNLNLAMTMKNDIIVGLFYSVEDEDQIPNYISTFQSLTRTVHYEKFAEDQYLFYLSIEQSSRRHSNSAKIFPVKESTEVLHQ
ncbi:hypothetical protein GPJ56_007205 [Histomonas meleagridis]|nr:hypothetical protein GPJ56_007205 [Histomonas meleagridis]